MTTEAKCKALGALVQGVWCSECSSMYRDLWNTPPAAIDSLEALQKLPPCSWDTLSAYPFKDRLYTTDPCLLTKVVYRENTPLLVARTFEDIREEVFGIPSARPLLLFSTQHETLEKSIWQYEHNYLPLLGEQNTEITASLAQLYEIDCIVCDTAALKSYLPDIALVYDRANIKEVVVIDSDFDLSFLQKQFPESAVHCILALPEVGTIGTAWNIKKDATPIFETITNTLIEIGDDGELIISRTLELPTPIIRYRTPLKATWADEQHTTFRLIQ